MNTWIFQGNPCKLAVDAYIRSSKEINWLVKQKYYAPKMFIGDEVYLWCCADQSNKQGELIARALMLSLPYEHADWQGDAFKLDTTWDTHGLGVDLLLQEVRSTDTYHKQIDFLKNLKVLRSRNKTNFLLEDEEAFVLKQIWGVN